MPQKISKTFQEGGRWVEKPAKTEILLCLCGNKYIKTRDSQVLCVRCINRQKLISPDSI